MKKSHKIYLLLSFIIMLVFFIIKTIVLFEIIPSQKWTRITEYMCFILFIPLFRLITKDFISKSKNLELGRTELESFIDSAAIISKADKNGKITYVNKKFTEVSGWELEEVLGKDHNVVNSGQHPKETWTEMYKTVVKDKKIWNKVVTNISKNGSFYYVDTYVKADFNDKDELMGFMSIRQDVTELKRKEIEIRNRMEAINKSNAVIEFDLDGNVMFANDLFLKTMGYKTIKEGGLDEIVGKHHRIFVDKEYSNSKEYRKFWKTLKKGMYVSGEFERLSKNGNIVWLQASYNPVIDFNGEPYKIMKMAQDITNMVEQRQEIDKKNSYLEHAAKILRHDMHSGINTYMPRGVTSLERRLKPEDVETLKLEAPLKMIKEGLKHSQKVYKGVYEFTNLVKKDAVLTKTTCNLTEILHDYLNSTAYSSQVKIDELVTLDVNESLFCTAIDNLIRNGLKYNDSDSKFVNIYMEDGFIVIQDNGRGMTQKDFDHLSQPYTRKEGQKESGTGLGLNICIAILKEHGFSITCEKNEIGTKIKIK